MDASEAANTSEKTPAPGKALSGRGTIWNCLAVRWSASNSDTLLLFSGMLAVTQRGVS